jgi:hypothetical protein
VISLRHIAILAMLVVLPLQAAPATQPAATTAPSRKVARKAPPRAVALSGDRLVYTADENGDRVPDYSYAGYASGSVAIPSVPARIDVKPIAGDNTERIQQAIDYVAKLPPDENGFRGAVLLAPGKFEIAGALRISTSGVVLRGSGTGDAGTALIAIGQDRRTLITVAGKMDRAISATPTAIAERYVPVGATKVALSDASHFKVGDTVLVRRPSPAAWIQPLKMHDSGGGMGNGWRPGSRDLLFDRTVTAVDGNTITIDVPLTCSLDPAFGGASVAAYTFPGRVDHVGIENLRCDSAFDANNAIDEAHSWIAITMDSVWDAWVRQVTFSHFAGGAVNLFDHASRVTVEDCKSLAPVSELAGYRRHTFFTSGQQCLFQRCYSEEGRHDFAVGFCAPGPNAFVQCTADRAHEHSGSIDSWSTGILYDNVRIDGNAISLMDRRYNNFFAGWSAANSLIWQCSASLINCFDPPGAHNWCFGSWGTFTGDSVFAESDNFVKPVSLYYAQLAERIGDTALARAQLMPRSTVGESRNPTPQDAAAATAASKSPARSMSGWIAGAPQRNPIPISPTDLKSLDELPSLSTQHSAPSTAAHRLAVTNGWLTVDGHLLTGSRLGIKWWRGGVRPDEVAEAVKDGPNITRFVPGRNGPGLTDDLNELADTMLANHRPAIDYHYGLWYDLRDIDHERNRRMNADAWPPFYEMPFARSGQGIAWDGLGKYDLTKFNSWYWSRLKQFAEIADARGLVLMHNNFFQHNILEAGAHYASSMWRPANNINQMDLPEPPPYAGDKLIYLADQFYDVSNPHRAAIFRGYIRKCLDNFADNTNVIQYTSGEYSGPTAFVAFWLDTIAEWERETGKHPLIALAAPKDVQDAILADEKRAAVVDVIDIRYWWYQPDGHAFAPPGGKNLSPRQWYRTQNPKWPNFDSTVRAVREYRAKFPTKAVTIHPNDGAPPAGLAVLFAGGSMPDLHGLDEHLLTVIPTLHPIESPNELTLADPGKNYLVYSAAGTIHLDLSDAGGTFTSHWINPSTGAMINGEQVRAGKTIELSAPSGKPPAILWLTRE